MPSSPPPQGTAQPHVQRPRGPLPTSSPPSLHPQQTGLTEGRGSTPCAEGMTRAEGPQGRGGRQGSAERGQSPRVLRVLQRTPPGSATRGQKEEPIRKERMGDGTAQERGSPPRGSRSSGERGRLPENHTWRAGSVGEAATATRQTVPWDTAPLQAGAGSTHRSVSSGTGPRRCPRSDCKATSTAGDYKRLPTFHGSQRGCFRTNPQPVLSPSPSHRSQPLPWVLGARTGAARAARTHVLLLPSPRSSALIAARPAPSAHPRPRGQHPDLRPCRALHAKTRQAHGPWGRVLFIKTGYRRHFSGRPLVQEQENPLEGPLFPDGTRQVSRRCSVLL